MATTEYRCPAEIADLFETEELAASRGRLRALEWIKGLNIKVGDTILLPEVGGGWVEVEKVKCAEQ